MPPITLIFVPPAGARDETSEVLDLCFPRHSRDFGSLRQSSPEAGEAGEESPKTGYNQIMDIISDTRPEIAALQRRLLRQVTPARKLAMLGQMNQTVKTLALSGLRSRYPNDTPEMLKRRLADLLLGPTLASIVYGPCLKEG